MKTIFCFLRRTLRDKDIYIANKNFSSLVFKYKL